MKNFLREALFAALPTFIVWVIVILVAVGFCFSAERPAINLPDEYRKSNWLSPNGYGSCVHAAFITLLKWQGRYSLAEQWDNWYSGGEWHTSFEKKLEKRGVRFAYTAEAGDVSFLEWACNTRRGCAVTVMGGNHMVTLVHLDKDWAAILDNNATRDFIWIPRERFLAEWKASYSWAVTPVYKPSAPAPEYAKEARFSRKRGRNESRKLVQVRAGKSRNYVRRGNFAGNLCNSCL